MENASKALLMVASVLIGVVIVTLAVYLFVSFSASANEIEQQLEEGKLQQFNNQFTLYETKENLTIYDVITVANLAIENNHKYGLTSASNNNFYITVILEREGELTKKDSQALSNYLKNLTNQLIDVTDRSGQPVKKLKNYKCKVSFNSQTARVNKVEFSDKNT